MNSKLIAVTGYFGAPIYDTAKKTAKERGLPLVSLDEEISKRDGRSIKRLVMMSGEHGYRNKEYEVLKELASRGESVVVACGDGVLYDDDSAAIIAGGELVIIGEDLSIDELWEGAKLKSDSYHAFMSVSDEALRRKAFDDFVARQRALFKKRIY